MTEEQKFRLKCELAARLPYGVMCNIKEIDGYNLKLVGVGKKYYSLHDGGDYMPKDYTIDEIIPYLRPMESMTDAEKKEVLEIFQDNNNPRYRVNDYGCIKSIKDIYGDALWYDCETMGKWIYWLNSHHFDHTDLIYEGLALKAPEGMYNFERKKE